MEASKTPLTPQFSIINGIQFIIECYVKPDAVSLTLNDNEVNSPLVFVYNHQLFLWHSTEAIETAEKFLPGSILKIKKDDWPQTLSKLVMPLTKEYKVDFRGSFGIASAVKCLPRYHPPAIYKK